MWLFISDEIPVSLLVGVFILFMFFVLVIKYRYIYFRIQNASPEALYFDDVRKVYDALQKGKEPQEKYIHTYANQLGKRVLLYELLLKYNRLELFPEALQNRKDFAASYVALWLEDHMEVDEIPPRLEHATTKYLKDGTVLEVFQFEMYEPHILASKGVLYAYAGYLSDNPKELGSPDFEYSNLSTEMLAIERLEELQRV
ncbi:hypothetical protein SAMN05216480_112107 [Pustulibacterium marinum]|uniref:Uncharacterized protein n=1 Tax=Pustulibacterium marinum TaxID=1224947 RepID=A0A1I7I357_9FLAO|nr:hypothetical protein [Pustulibacterium marinum]SFU67196.1 hypothetical protein SAMN05216480_112107 [Pustulibacterium marinum]